MVSKFEDGKFILSIFYKVLSFIKKGEIVSFLKLTIYLSIYFDERQKGIRYYELTIIKLAYHNLSPPFCIS